MSSPALLPFPCPGVLVVEDDELLRDVTAELLSSQGHQVHTASNVREGLNVLQEHRPAWAVVDFQLSDGDGLDFIERIREQQNHPGMKFMAVTGWFATDGRVGEFIKASNHYLTKPVDWSHLFQLIDPA